MIDISALLDEIKASPYREIVITAPHTGRVTFAGLKTGDKVLGPQGQWKEKPGTQLATLERERNPKPICTPEKGEISELHSELEGCFVEAGTPLAVLRHMLTREEVQRAILQKALHLFRAPERAKYYFTPEVDKKIRASDAHSVAVRDGMELLIMSRMKREVPLHYTGPERGPDLHEMVQGPPGRLGTGHPRSRAPEAGAGGGACRLAAARSQRSERSTGRRAGQSGTGLRGLSPAHPLTAYCA